MEAKCKRARLVAVVPLSCAVCRRKSIELAWPTTDDDAAAAAAVEDRQEDSLSACLCGCIH